MSNKFVYADSVNWYEIIKEIMIEEDVKFFASIIYTTATPAKIILFEEENER